MVSLRQGFYNRSLVLIEVVVALVLILGLITGSPSTNCEPVEHLFMNPLTTGFIPYCRSAGLEIN